jgi:hypothetical protein
MHFDWAGIESAHFIFFSVYLRIKKSEHRNEIETLPNQANNFTYNHKKNELRLPLCDISPTL